MSLDDIKRSNRTHHDLIEKVLALESRLAKLEVENGVLKRALGWEVFKHGVHLREVASRIVPVFTTLEEPERRVLEGKE